MTKPSAWDIRFLKLALHIADWSKDPSTKVGAVIIDHHRRIVSTGYNGAPTGVVDVFNDRDQKLYCTIHAEMNAILFAKRDLTDCSLYVTHPPCAGCAAAVVQSGISQVTYIRPAMAFSNRWAASLELAKKMFAEARVQLIPVEFD